MNHNNQINFISQKINQLQTALLHIHSNSLLKLPTTIVETLHVDELGCVWLALNKPTQYVHEFDRSFHVGLNFYRKGTDFYLNTYGLGRVVIDPEEMNHIPAQIPALLNGRLLLCVRILEANYYEKTAKQDQNIFQKCKQTLSELFAGNNEYYHFKSDDVAHFA
jgi:hypothetical protein